MTSNSSYGVGMPNSELETYPVAKLLQNVEKSYDAGKNLLAESKKADEDAALYRDGDETFNISPDGATSAASQHSTEKSGSVFDLHDIWKDQSMGMQRAYHCYCNLLES